MKSFYRLAVFLLLGILISGGAAGCDSAATVVTSAETRLAFPYVIGTNYVATLSAAEPVTEQAITPGVRPRRTTSTPLPSPTDTPLTDSASFPMPTHRPTFASPSVGITVDIPGWATSPETELILIAYRNESGGRPVRLGLVNPASGEEVEIELGQAFYHFYWKDAGHVVFFHGESCAGPPTAISEFDLSQGMLKQYDPQAQPELLRDCYPIADEQAVQVLPEDAEHSLVLVDAKAGKTFQLTIPNDGSYDLSFLVSPDRNYVAVLQSTEEYEFSERERPVIGNQISIYRLRDRVLVLKVTGVMDFSSLRFFPDSVRLIYMWKNTPCVIEIPSQTPKCLMYIPGTYPGADIYLGSLTAEAKQMGFMYINDDPYHGGLCFYELFSGDIHCPTDQFESLQGYGVIDYAVSPDGGYVLFHYTDEGCPRPWCDNFGGIHLAVVDMGGNRMYELGDEETLASDICLGSGIGAGVAAHGRGACAVETQDVASHIMVIKRQVMQLKGMHYRKPIKQI